MIKNINIGSTKPLGAVSYFNQLGSKTKNVYNKLIDEQDSINNKDLVCVKTDGTIYGFTTFKDPIKFASNIYQDGSTSGAKNFQNEMLAKINNLEKYNPTNQDKINSKKEVLLIAKVLHNSRNKVINAFENGIFPYNYSIQNKEESDVQMKHYQIG